MLIGKRLKDLRLKKGLSQQELGDLLGVTKVSVCGYENGTRTPSLETFILIAQIFNTTTDYLLGREITIINNESNEFLGKFSKEDVEMINEFKKYNSFYEKISKSPRRYVSLINKKLK